MPSTSDNSRPAAPVAEKRPTTDTRHGITRHDDYAWMRDDNWQAVFKDPSILGADIRSHLEAENAWCKAWFAPLADLRKALVAEMRGRIKEDDSSVPSPDGPWAYGVSYKQGGEQPRFFRIRRDEPDGEPVIHLDGDKEAEGKAYFRIGAASPSPDHSLLLWSHDDNGSEYFTIRLRDMASLQDKADRLTDTAGDGAFTADGNGFFYCIINENHRPSKLFFHRIGDAQSEDRLVYEETDSGFFMDVGASRLNDLIFVSITDHESSEVRLIPADRPEAEPVIVHPRTPGLEYEVEEGGDVLFILTNADDAKDFKIMEAPANAPQKAHWREVVPHEPGRLILAVQAYRGHLVWLERRDGLPRIVIRDRATGEDHAIAFSEEAYSLGLSGSREYDTSVIRFTYSSMTTPSQTFDYDMATRERRLLKMQEVPSGHDPEAYVTRRLMAPAADGELVPVSVLYRKDTPLDGSAPCLLYGYGSYGITVPASFNANILSYVDRGMVYAIAHIRGGKDKGYAWYEGGKRAAKMNTFTDFIAAGRHLCSQGYTAPGKIVAEGRSAGGLLMGAVVNMAPDLFAGIIAGVPFVDALTTMLDDTLPLTPPEWTEWGNPIESKADYETIAAYSPIDNVRPQAYPAIFAQAGLTDPRVTYWEPAKWVAKLREHTTGTAPILLDINMDAGHGGNSGRFARLEETAMSQAFALACVGKAG